MYKDFKTRSPGTFGEKFFSELFGRYKIHPNQNTSEKISAATKPHFRTETETETETSNFFQTETETETKMTKPNPKPKPANVYLKIQKVKAQ